MRKKYGLKINKRKDPRAYKFGGGHVPMEVLQPDGNWQDFLPVKEFQNLNQVEPYACVPFTLLNCIETVLKHQLMHGKFSRNDIQGWLERGILKKRL